MYKIFIFCFSLLPVVTNGQSTLNIKTIDSIVSIIDRDPTIIKKVHDTASYEKEDGGNNWDSLRIHREYYYKNGEIIKIIGWNKYGNWRNDQVAYYLKSQPIKFSKGESFNGQPDYGSLNYDIYYNKDKDIGVVWLIPKPDNVLGIATDIYLQWAYSLLKKAM